MKVKRRIFGVVIICLLVAVIAFSVFADGDEADQYTGTVAEAEEILLSLDTASDVRERVEILDELVLYLKTVDPNEEGRDTLDASIDEKEKAVAEELIARAEGATDTLNLGIYFRELSAFLKKHPLSSASDMSALRARRDAIEVRFEKEKTEALYELEDLTYVKDYTTSPYVNNNFDSIKTGGFTAENNKDSSTVLSYIGEDGGMDGSNNYYTIRFDYVGKHLRATSYLPAVEDAVLFEFDCTTFDHLPDVNVKFEDYSSKNGTTWNIVYLSFNSKGDLVRSNQVLLENAITPGEWTHISVAVDTVTSQVSIYVDYQLIHTFSAAHPTLGYAFSPTMMRVGTSVSHAGGSFSMDNVKIYRGHAPRLLGRYEAFSEKDKFIFQVSQIFNSQISATGRYAYYSTAEALLPSFYLDGVYLDKDPKLTDAVDRFLSFNKDKLASEVAKINLATLSDYVASLESFTPSEDNADNRSYWIAECESFLGKLGGLIETGEEYDRLLGIIDGYRVGISKEEVADEFVIAVNSFFSASTVDKKQALYDTAVSLIPSLDLEYLLSGNFPAFADAYTRSSGMKEVLDEQIAINNSKLFLAVLAYVSMYDTEAEWEANYDFIDTYITIARGIIASGNYDPYYTGVERMMPTYENMNAYFYAKLQEEHILHVSSELLKYQNSDIYFEKYGIIAKLEQYMEENEIDPENETLSAYRETIASAYSELEADKDAYEELLAENTRTFIELSARLSGSISYSEMKEICDTIAPYIHMMDVSAPDARDAIAMYGARKEEIRKVEEYAEEFIASVLLIDLSNNRLEAFIAIAQYVDRVEMDVEGVKEALNKYETAMKSYDEGIADANRDVLDIALLAVYMRNYEGLGSLITLAEWAVKD